MVTLFYELWDDQHMSAPLLSKQFANRTELDQWIDEQNLNPKVYIKIVQIK